MAVTGDRCDCGRLVFLYVDRAGHPCGWSGFGTEESGRLREVLAGGTDPWPVLVEALERVVVAKAMFTPVTICECGQRWRAVKGPPWIRKVDDAG